jgi:hypothetical protein
MHRSRVFSLSLAGLIGLSIAALPVQLPTSRSGGIGVAQAEAAPAKQKAKKKSAGKRKTIRKRTARRSKPQSSSAAAIATPQTLDPSHVAPEIVEGAAQKTPIELLADYKRTAEEGDLETAAVLLTLAAEKPVTRILVGEVNMLLGVPLDGEDSDVLVEISETSRTAYVAKQVAPERAKTGFAATLEHAHSVTMQAGGATPGSPVERLAAYKRAVGENDLPTAAKALTAAVQAPLVEETVLRANLLLDLDMAPGTAGDLARMAQLDVASF